LLEIQTTKGVKIMTRRIAILVTAIGMSIGLASRVTTNALAQPQDEKVRSDDKMKDDKMAGDKMEHNDKMAKKKKKSGKKDKMAHDKMSDQDKMDHPQQ
jgi:pentapeptide MXKDX repeat protein